MVNFGGIVDDIDQKVVCPVCGGTRLNPNARLFKIDGKSIDQVAAMEISELQEWLKALPAKLNSRENA